ncbi:hypothetical protein RB195_017696 [Necator americanus]|uniref:Nanos-type domain-containing protein n=1 Tax=Necator americanus TaxID=51031 RepID=A0ABR1C7E3_NECAM
MGSYWHAKESKTNLLRCRICKYSVLELHPKQRQEAQLDPGLQNFFLALLLFSFGMFSSMAPFPNDTWTMTSSEKNSSMDFYYLEDTSDAPLWQQPTDRLRALPQPAHEAWLSMRNELFEVTDIPNVVHPTKCEEKLYLHSWSTGTVNENSRNVKRCPKTISASSAQKEIVSTQARCSNSTSAECAYCKSVGKVAVGHAKTACPVLFSMKPCSLCGADGYENHTETYCPSKEKVKLELNPSYLMRADQRKREREWMRMWIASNS